MANPRGLVGQKSIPVTISASNETKTQIIKTGKCYFHGFLVGQDGVNDTTITAYDSLSATGTEVVPTTQYDASALGINGAMLGHPTECRTGLTFVVTTSGAAEVTVYYNPVMR